MNPIRRLVEFLEKDEKERPWLYPIMPFFAGLVIASGLIILFWQFWPGIGAFTASVIASAIIGLVIEIFGRKPSKK
ncbi:MAG TPA: hypothetical protein PLA41_01180 [Candidatus Pacearchaeota archaeon]|nr:hypothetical protein [Candidatus Pacearchaeota archaeon]HQI74722.1 hypothetical protein [Candidatus Pacearchaeota archaeon]